jgi:hypothetical protein
MLYPKLSFLVHYHKVYVLKVFRKELAVRTITKVGYELSFTIGHNSSESHIKIGKQKLDYNCGAIWCHMSPRGATV